VAGGFQEPADFIVVGYRGCPSKRDTAHARALSQAVSRADARAHRDNRSRTARPPHARLSYHYHGLSRSAIGCC